MSGKRHRLRLFKLGAVVFGFLLIGLAELVCRLAGWGGGGAYEDPFVGFKGVNPLFELSAGGDRYEVAKAKLKFFSPESFSATKKAGTTRIFCLGGSTVKGRPYAKETAFSSWLGLSLAAADPNRGWEVVNCGGISYASYRLVNLMRECLQHQPDLFVVCTGHNEFLEDRTYEGIKGMPAALARSQHWASNLRLYRLLKPVESVPIATNRFEMADEVEALLDFRGGLEVYDRNEQWRDDVVAHFEHNLRAMIELASAAGVPVIFIRPPSNLRGSPPFKSEHKNGLSLDETLDWESEIQAARKFYATDMDKSVEHLEAALRIDDRFAATHYEIGKCHEAMGQRTKAMKAYLRALEEDVCPLRMIQPLVTAMARVADESSTPLIDVHAMLQPGSRLNILGSDQLVDHIHPSIEGHKQIANAILSRMGKLGMVRKKEGWESRRAESFSRHFESLDAAYFAAARRALHGLNEWAAGRAEGAPIGSRPSPAK